MSNFKLASGASILAISALLLSGCTAASSDGIPNSVKVVEDATPETDVAVPDANPDANQTDKPDTITNDKAIRPSDAKNPAELNLPNPNMSDDPVQALSTLANNSIFAMSYLGSYEYYYNDSANSDVVLAYDPQSTGEQLAIRYTNRDTGLVEIFSVSETTEPNKSKWLAAYQAVFLAGSTESVTITVEEDYINVDMATSTYKYYFEDGVITRLVGTYITEPDRLLEWFVEYRNDEKVTDLVNAVN